MAARSPPAFPDFAAHDRPWLPRDRETLTMTQRIWRMALVVAIDGPNASGKGTLARRLAEACLAHLDTYCIYRAVAFKLLQAGISPDNITAAVDAAKQLIPQDLDNSLF